MHAANWGSVVGPGVPTRGALELQASFLGLMDGDIMAIGDIIDHLHPPKNGGLHVW